MSWNDITITDEGSRLLADMIGGGKLTITRAAIGSGTVSIEDLPSQTDVLEPINAPALLAGKEPTEDGKGTILKIQIRNDGVTETTRMRQIAVFAKTDQADEVLLVILQDEIGEEVPSYSEFPQFEINQWITLAISRTNNISVIVPPTVYPSRTEFEHLRNDVREMIELFGCNTRKEIAKRLRDPGKPDYGAGGGGDAAGVTLITAEHTGNADVTVVIGGKEYDGKNISRRAEDAPSGTLIIKEEK